MINDSELKQIISDFSIPRDEFNGKSYITRRLDWFEYPMKNIRPLLLEKSLDNLTLDQAQKIYKEMRVGGPKLYGRTFIENGLDNIRASLKYLLFGGDPLEDRFYNFAGNPDSDYYLNGVGRDFASTALFLINHKEYGIWNSAIDNGLKYLGILPEKKKENT